LLDCLLTTRNLHLFGNRFRQQLHRSEESCASALDDVHGSDDRTGFQINGDS